MKELMAMMKEMNAKLTALAEEVAALKKQPKPTPTKEEKPDTSFAGLYGKVLTNADGSGKKFKHSAELKDSSEDDWFGVWDAKSKVIKRINEDGSETDEVYESFGDFGTAHYKSLGENSKKKKLTPPAAGTRSRCWTASSASSSPPTRCCRRARSRAR